MQNFYSLAVECVLNWGYIFPDFLDRNQEPIFKIRSLELRMNRNINIPDKFQFFKNAAFFEEMKENQKRATEGKYG